MTDAPTVPIVTWISEVPADVAVTVPDVETVATDGVEDVQTGAGADVIGMPCASSGVAVMARVESTARVNEPGFI